MFTTGNFVGVAIVVIFYVSFLTSTAGVVQTIVVWFVVASRIIILYSYLAEMRSETSEQI
jgi:hypothetical protein